MKLLGFLAWLVVAAMLGWLSLAPPPARDPSCLDVRLAIAFVAMLVFFLSVLGQIARRGGSWRYSSGDGGDGEPGDGGGDGGGNGGGD